MSFKTQCDLCGTTVVGVFAGLTNVDGDYLCPACVRIRRSGGRSPTHVVEDNVHRCPYCREEIQPDAVKCKHCGEYLTPELRLSQGGSAPQKSNAAAGFLALILGPVGLWYKGNWAAGFAWLVMAVVLIASAGVFVAPLLWIGMIAHAIVAKPK